MELETVLDRLARYLSTHKDTLSEIDPHNATRFRDEFNFFMKALNEYRSDMANRRKQMDEITNRFEALSEKLNRMSQPGFVVDAGEISEQAMKAFRESGPGHIIANQARKNVAVWIYDTPAGLLRLDSPFIYLVGGKHDGMVVRLDGTIQARAMNTPTFDGEHYLYSGKCISVNPPYDILPVFYAVEPFMDGLYKDPTDMIEKLMKRPPPEVIQPWKK